MTHRAQRLIRALGEDGVKTDKAHREPESYLASASRNNAMDTSMLHWVRRDLGLCSKWVRTIARCFQAAGTSSVEKIATLLMYEFPDLTAACLALPHLK